MSIVGVIPAAGYATRLQPLTCSKEVCVVRGRPVMDYLVEQMWLGGCTDLRVVTRREKRDVVDHANDLGATVVEGHPASVTESLLLGLDGVGPDETVLFGFPDILWDPVDGFRRLVTEIGPACDVVLGLFRGRELERSDVVVYDESSRLVTAVQVKPAQPRSKLVWGCFAARRGALSGVERHPEPGYFFGELAEAGGIRGVYLSDFLLDVGTPEALAVARRGEWDVE
jgi:glucose-1-phosphate thymidylyltransferase